MNVLNMLMFGGYWAKWYQQANNSVITGKYMFPNLEFYHLLLVVVVFFLKWLLVTDYVKKKVQ